MTTYYVKTDHGVIAVEAEDYDEGSSGLYLSNDTNETYTFFRAGTWFAHTTDKKVAEQWGYKE